MPFASPQFTALAITVGAKGGVGGRNIGNSFVDAEEQPNEAVTVCDEPAAIPEKLVALCGVPLSSLYVKPVPVGDVTVTVPVAVWQSGCVMSTVGVDTLAHIGKLLKPESV